MYVVIDILEKQSYLVTDASDVAKIIGKHANTVRRWFRDVEYKYVKNRYHICKDYIRVTSGRGKHSVD